MIKGVISKGVMVPREPLPGDWREGTEVVVELYLEDASSSAQCTRADIWMDEVEALARQGNQEDDLRLQAALEEIHRREKDLARKRMDSDS